MLQDQPHPGAVKKSLVRTHGTAVAVQSLATCLGIAPRMRFDLLEEKTRDELKTLDPDAAQKAVEALEGIDVHTDKARKHADRWNEDVLRQLFATAADVHGHATQFLPVAGELRSQIAALGTKPTPDRQREVLESVRARLKAQQKPVDKRARAAKELVDELTAFAADVKGDSTDFEKDREAVDKAVTGKGSVIDAINQKVATLNDQLAKDAKPLAQGATDKIPGIGLLVIGGLFVVGDSSAAGVGFLTSGLGLLAQPGTTVSGGDLNKEKAELAALQADLSVLQASVSCFRTTQRAITQLSADAEECRAGGQDLHQAWLSHGKALADTVKTVDDVLKKQPAPDLSRVLTDADRYLSSATDEWTDARKTADTVEACLVGIRDHVDESRVDEPTKA
ncbi:HBL/NHE enterotoxin family protein [Streptomyces flavidovirens]|uniref:HBL/NHE enterotoxin family protein n=1 Tax=Streptomyces flavidovirens TaxID=67298 RepID=UPI0033B2AF19